MTVTVFLSGDQIGTFSGLTSGGNANGTRVALSGVQTLGGPDDVFRVVVSQVGSGQSSFLNGQRVEVFDADDNPVFSALNPQHDQFQGRASSANHQIFTDQNVVFMVDGVSPDADGQVQFGPGFNPPRGEQLPFSAFPSVVPCFVAGTRIATPDGPRRVEQIAPGDPVLTLDDGPQPVVWTGRRRTVGRGRLAPVAVAPGVLGNGGWLRVSPQHRMLLSGPGVELAFAEAQVLAPAVGLVDGRRILRAPFRTVEYVHLLFDRHQIVWAEGALCESFLPGRTLLGADARVAEELRALFPGLDRHGGSAGCHAGCNVGGHVGWPAARRVLSTTEARVAISMGALPGAVAAVA